MREVLLIGDSIRMFYEKSLYEKLGGGYHVSSPSENCRFAAYTRNSLRLWLPEFPKPEIIHWDNGLWDVARLYGENECFTPLDRYLDDDPDRPEGGNSARGNDVSSFQFRHNKLQRGRREAHARERDSGERSFSVVYPRVHDYISDDLIHPNNNGIEAIASATADFIRNF